MKVQGRIIACGMISDYNRSDDPNPITNLWQVVARQLTIQGFLLYSFAHALPRARADLNRWVGEGKIKVMEHITRGIANTPAAYAELMSGKTTGKALLELDLPEEEA
jgi:NADPH-dependent curcumin reductase CurA